MPASLLKATIATVFVITSLGLGTAHSAERASPGLSSTPLQQRAADVKNRTMRLIPIRMKCGVFSLSGADSRHVVVWRSNGAPVPAGTKVQLKILNHTVQATLPTLGQGEKHMVQNATPSPVPHASRCQAKVI